jgi:hypothetical protein
VFFVLLPNWENHSVFCFIAKLREPQCFLLYCQIERTTVFFVVLPNWENHSVFVLVLNWENHSVFCFIAKLREPHSVLSKGYITFIRIPQQLNLLHPTPDFTKHYVNWCVFQELHHMHIQTLIWFEYQSKVDTNSFQGFSLFFLFSIL